jgi:hypothetical protein
LELSEDGRSLLERRANHERHSWRRLPHEAGQRQIDVVERARDRRLKTRDHEFAARGIARKNRQGVAAERRGAAIVNDAHHEIRPCGLKDERAVRRALRDVRLKEHDRLNAAPPRFFEKADFGDGREQALIGAMPDVDDLWSLVGDEQAVEERHLPLDLAEVDDVRRFRKEHCIKRLPEIRVEAFTPTLRDK